MPNIAEINYRPDLREARASKGTTMGGTTTNVSEDQDAIAKTMRYHIDGGKSGRGADMKPAFHPEATIFGYIGADLFAGPIQKLFDWNDQNGPAAGMEARLGSVEVAGTVATARVEIDNWTGHRFTDMFTLLKVDGEWRIISKVFHLHR